MTFEQCSFSQNFRPLRGGPSEVFALRRSSSKVFARCAAAQAKFSSTFFKRWQDSKGRRPLAAIRRWRNSLSFRRIWGFGGLYKRKAPKAPLFCAHLAANGLPNGEVAPQGPEGALALCFPAAAGGLVTEKFLSFGISRLPPQKAVPSGAAKASPFKGRWPEGPKRSYLCQFCAPPGRGFSSYHFPASCRRGCRVPPRQAGYFLVQTRK